VYLWHALVIISLKQFVFPESTVLFQDWLLLVISSILLTTLTAWATQVVLEKRLSK
jgi:peptidoglycan/LPS O-acetylase OafA/YrhL